MQERRQARDSLADSAAGFRRRLTDPFGLKQKVKDAPLTGVGVSAATGLLIGALLAPSRGGKQRDDDHAFLGLGALAGFMARSIVFPEIGRVATELAKSKNGSSNGDRPALGKKRPADGKSGDPRSG